MQIATYEFISPSGRFAISLRPYGRWRIRCAGGVIDRSFATAQDALDELLLTEWPLPRRLEDWTQLAAHTGETITGDLDP